MITNAKQLVDAMDAGIVEAIGYSVGVHRVVVQCKSCGATEETQVTRTEMLLESHRRRAEVHQ